MACDKDEESSSTKSPRVSSTKIELKLFTGKENFMLWQRRMKHVLKQQGLSKVLGGKEKKLTTMTYEDWEDLDELTRGSIEQHLTDEVLCNAMEDTAKQTWERN
ncbi:PREDICTED: RecName Full=Retrovirus-related Pol poly from transposon TNT 1-94 [Prunus dulcis]|uniref:Retrotransposon Copia-like N-terminal domain-containing protein n=1 Tax=Prunus dulcis TaxID=3755 RepID=A0A5E4FKI4_PRUDU|nr:PREDICTED: RecName Full=Retrovirus-related Pol poly from transposon TNT 1-94 [Prunus dulcis]